MLLGMKQSTSDDRGLQQMKAALHDAINRRFAYVKTAPHIIAATLLYPHFKDAYLSRQVRDCGCQGRGLDFMCDPLKSLLRTGD